MCNNRNVKYRSTPILSLTLFFTACGQIGSEEQKILDKNVFRVDEQLNLYSESIIDDTPTDEVPGENDPPPVDPPTSPPGSGGGTTPPPAGEPPVDPPPAGEPPIDPPSPPADITLPIVRACWDRPLIMWPTVANSGSQALFAYRDATKKRIFQTTLTASDFKNQKPTLSIPANLLNQAKEVEICQTNYLGNCIHKNDYDYTAISSSGLILVTKGTPGAVLNGDQSYFNIGQWQSSPFQPAERRLLSKVSTSEPLYIIVENLGKYSGSQKNQKKQEYCDVVFKSTSPLALDFTGEGFVPRSQMENMVFDLDADSSLERMSALGSNAGILVIDLNANGIVDDGRELFGEKTLIKESGLEAQNGFEALAQYDTNKDSVIDANDPVWKELRIWVDINEDGKTDSGEVRTLEEQQVVKLALTYKKVSEFDAFGNEVQARSVFWDSSGRPSHLADIWYMTISEVTN